MDAQTLRLKLIRLFAYNVESWEATTASGDHKRTGWTLEDLLANVAKIEKYVLNGNTELIRN